MSVYSTLLGSSRFNSGMGVLAQLARQTVEVYDRTAMAVLSGQLSLYISFSELVGGGIRKSFESSCVSWWGKNSTKQHSNTSSSSGCETFYPILLSCWDFFFPLDGGNITSVVSNVWFPHIGMPRLVVVFS